MRVFRSEAPKLHQRIHRRVICAVRAFCNFKRARQNAQHLLVLACAACVELCDLARRALRRELRIQSRQFSLRNTQCPLRTGSVSRKLHDGVHGKNLCGCLFLRAAAQQQRQRQSQHRAGDRSCFCHAAVTLSHHPVFSFLVFCRKKLFFHLFRLFISINHFHKKIKFSFVYNEKTVNNTPKY